MLKVLQRVSIPSIDPLNLLGEPTVVFGCTQCSTYLVISRSSTLAFGVRYNMIQSTLVSLKRNAFVRKRLLKKTWKPHNDPTMTTKPPVVALLQAQVSNEYNCIFVYSSLLCVCVCLCLCSCMCVCMCAHLCSLSSNVLFAPLRQALLGPSSWASRRSSTSGAPLLLAFNRE